MRNYSANTINALRYLRDNPGSSPPAVACAVWPELCQTFAHRVGFDSPSSEVSQEALRRSTQMLRRMRRQGLVARHRGGGYAIADLGSRVICEAEG